MGYAVMGSIALFIAATLSVGIATGVANDEARDPYTGELVTQDDERCERWASSLLDWDEALSDDSESRAVWVIQARGWRHACVSAAHESKAQSLLERLDAFESR